MKKSKLFLILGSILALSACNNKGGNTVWGTPCPDTFTGYEALSAEKRKDTYSTYLSYMPSTLNYTKTMQSENASHIANFVDGLVEHDRFGNLVPCLAETTGEHNEDYTEWSFKVKKGIKWVTSEGKPYQKDGKDVEVCAEDFRTVLRVVLNSATASESAYLPMLIIKGAEQYFAATAAYNANMGTQDVTARNQAIFNSLRQQGLTEGCSVKDIPAILNFEKVGVKVDAENNKITYVLTQPSDYFPTMLTYLPFLPLNYDYYQTLGTTLFGGKKDILFCGAYILKERTNVKTTYERNPYYWDLDSVKTKTIEYKIIPADISDSFARDEYEAGNIDGFSLSSQDSVGWDKYVKGKDGKGTIIEPHNDLTYSQEGQGDKSSFFFYINLSRPTKASSVSPMTSAQIINFNKAAKYSYFRSALYNALDLEAYNARNGFEELEQRQYQINTYTPKYFVTDNEGKDYFEYLLEAYQRKHDCSKKEAENALNPGQVNQISLKDSVSATKAAIEKLKKDDPTITYPITVEYSSLYGDSTEQFYDKLFIEYTNERLNGCIIDELSSDPNNTEGLKVCSQDDIKVKVVPNDKITSSQSYMEVSNSANYSLFVAGWGPDYGDPMTYAHTMVKGGDMADNLGIAKNAKLSDETEEKLAHYGELVNKANKIVSTSNEKKKERYSAFADAEMYLLEELALMKPLYQRGQGYSCSVSNFIPYRSPRSGYGLSGDKLKGMEILTEPLMACERRILKEEWDREKTGK